MAIKLIANYTKRLGLPAYSSHQFSIGIEAELPTVDEIPEVTARIYEMLQTNVDEQMQTTGFVPHGDYGMNPVSADHSIPPNPGASLTRWQCTLPQRALIENFVAENNLNKSEIESLAKHRFGKGVRRLRKQEASEFIDELFATYRGQYSENSTGRAA